MLIIKQGVKVQGLKEESLYALDQVTEVFTSYNYDCIMTAGRDKGHGNHSHHYKGHAVDIRSKHLPDDLKLEVLEAMRETLGLEYQCFFEGEGKSWEHFHIEYDPRQI